MFNPLQNYRTHIENTAFSGYPNVSFAMPHINSMTADTIQGRYVGYAPYAHNFMSKMHPMSTMKHKLRKKLSRKYGRGMYQMPVSAPKSYRKPPVSAQYGHVQQQTRQPKYQQSWI